MRVKNNKRKSIRAIKQAESFDNTNKKEAEIFLDTTLSQEGKKILARKKLIKDLSGVIPNNKI